MRKTALWKTMIICICLSSLTVTAAGCGSKDDTADRNTGSSVAQAEGRSKQDGDPDTKNRTDQMRDTTAGSSVDVPEHIKKQLHEKIQADAKVQSLLDTAGILYTYHAGYHILDDRQLQAVFFDDEEAVTKKADDEAQSFRCETADGQKYASSNNTVITFQRKEDADYGKVLSFCTDSRRMYLDTFDTVEIPERLSFMSGEEAKRIVRETAEKIGVELTPEPYVFAPLDEAALQALYEDVFTQMSADVSAEWADEVMQTYLPDVDFSGDKGCYYMLWQQQCPHGETIMSNNYVGDIQVPQNMGSYVMGIVNEKGLASFYAFYPFAFTDESRIESELLGVDEALEKIEELYKTVPPTGEYCITNITLQYAAIAEKSASGTLLKLVPAWCMETSEDNYRQYVVDAVSGVIF